MAGPRRVAGDSGHTQQCEPGPPPTHGDRAQLKETPDLIVRSAFCGQQDDPRPFGLTDRDRSASCPMDEFRPFPCAQCHGRRSPHNGEKGFGYIDPRGAHCGQSASIRFPHYPPRPFAYDVQSSGPITSQPGAAVDKASMTGSAVPIRHRPLTKSACSTIEIRRSAAAVRRDIRSYLRAEESNPRFLSSRRWSAGLTHSTSR